jgi:class 3 adenylate cyclase/alpha-beta hydrolase superfamily lysophospholipase
VDAEIAYAKSRGLNVAYSLLGEGPLDLVVVPGFVSHLEAALEHPSIERALRRLAGFARVISFDKPGTGLSDPIEGALTLEQRMEDLTAVLDAAGAERVALLGASEGAPMSALFAATHSDRTEALIMYGSYARGSAADDYPWAPEWAQIEAAEAMVEAEWGRAALLDLYAPSAADDPEFSRWWARYQRLAASPAMARAVLRLAAEIDIRDVLPAISVPTLVLHRSGDLLWPIEGARFVAERIPGARLVELPGIDHFPFAGEVGPLLDEVETFLTGTRRAPESDRKLLTVMFTDIVDSTDQLARLGDRRWRELLERHDALVRGELAAHGGREVKTTGDGFLATFEGPARAIECARAIVGTAPSIGIEIRAGVHTGECEVVGDDVAGMAVHIGARIGALADTREVWVSGTVKDLVVGSGLSFSPQGAHELKGVPGEWSIYRVEEDR